MLVALLVAFSPSTIPHLAFAAFSALERKIANLEDGIPAAPDDPGTSTGDTDTTLGMVFLRERPRR